MSAPKNLSPSDAYLHDRRGYQTGFILAAILTIVPFLLVTSGSLSRLAVLWVIGPQELLSQMHERPRDLDGNAPRRGSPAASPIDADVAAGHVSAPFARGSRRS